LTHLIIPGGESTTLHRLGSIYGLLDPIRTAIRGGIAVFGTCAGAILLGTGPEPPPRLGLVPAVVLRNAYGRQKESFSTDLRIRFLEKPFRGIFIRAPKIIQFENDSPDSDSEVLAVYGGTPVLIRYRRILLATFHPELTEDVGVHRYFLSL